MPAENKYFAQIESDGLAPCVFTGDAVAPPMQQPDNPWSVLVDIAERQSDYRCLSPEAMAALNSPILTQEEKVSVIQEIDFLDLSSARDMVKLWTGYILPTMDPESGWIRREKEDDVDFGKRVTLDRVGAWQKLKTQLNEIDNDSSDYPVIKRYLDQILEKITTENIGMVHSVLREMHISGNQSELMNAAMLGLANAVRDYDRTIGSAFSTVAFAYIRNECLKLMAKEHDSTYRSMQDLRVYRAAKEALRSQGIKISIENLAGHLGWPEAKVRVLWSLDELQTPKSLDADLRPNAEDPSNRTLLDTMPSTDAVGDIDLVVDVGAVLAQLPLYAITIVRMRALGAPLKEIGDFLGASRETIRQRLIDIRRHMKLQLEGQSPPPLPPLVTKMSKKPQATPADEGSIVYADQDAIAKPVRRGILTKRHEDNDILAIEGIFNEYIADEDTVRRLGRIVDHYHRKYGVERDALHNLALLEIFKSISRVYPKQMRSYWAISVNHINDKLIRFCHKEMSGVWNLPQTIAQKVVGNRESQANLEVSPVHEEPIAPPSEDNPDDTLIKQLDMLLRETCSLDEMAEMTDLDDDHPNSHKLNKDQIWEEICALNERERIGYGLGLLPEEMREAIVMFYGEGLTHEEIAAALGLTTKQQSIIFNKFKFHLLMSQKKFGPMPIIVVP